MRLGFIVYAAAVEFAETAAILRSPKAFPANATVGL
jgi:hypothetical protein